MLPPRAVLCPAHSCCHPHSYQYPPALWGILLFSLCVCNQYLFQITASIATDTHVFSHCFFSPSLFYSTLISLIALRSSVDSHRLYKQSKKLQYKSIPSVLHPRFWSWSCWLLILCKAIYSHMLLESHRKGCVYPLVTWSILQGRGTVREAEVTAVLQLCWCSLVLACDVNIFSSDTNSSLTHSNQLWQFILKTKAKDYKRQMMSSTSMLSNLHTV